MTPDRPRVRFDPSGDPMNADDLLDYALGRLEGARLREVEQRLAADPELAARAARIRAHLHALIDDGDEDLSPPADLLERTAALIAEHRRSRRRTYQDLLPVRVPFRWADVAVAAGIFLAGILTLLPVIQRTRSQADITACADNLRQLGVALTRYALDSGGYPHATAEAQAPYAGSFALRLHDAGYLPDCSILNCPGDGPNRMPNPLPTHAWLCSQDGHAASAPCLQNLDYAYHLGYREDHSCRPLPLGAAIDAPLVADRPPFRDSHAVVTRGNSPNHVGRGQNVLFRAGHVRWQTSRRWGTDSDIFLNFRNLLGPGLALEDAVLGPGPARFDGR